VRDAARSAASQTRDLGPVLASVDTGEDAQPVPALPPVGRDDSSILKKRIHNPVVPCAMRREVPRRRPGTGRPSSPGPDADRRSL